MFKPSPVLCARLRLTTKQVNGGYYKGNRTGSMGAHTEYGGYVIDYRKVRHFNVPDLTDFKLTPFVTNEMQPTERTQTLPDGTTYTPEKIDPLEFLLRWKREYVDEYEQVLDHQRSQKEAQLQSPKPDSTETAVQHADLRLKDQFMDEKRT